MGSMTQKQQQDVDRDILQRMNSYRGKSLLKKAAVNVLVKHLEASQISTLKEEFEKLDTDHSGFLEVEELQQAIKNTNMTLGE